MLTLVTGGDVYAPEPRGRQSVLLAHDRVVQVGAVDARALQSSGLPLDVIDATGCLVTPGLVDAHEHLIGGSGEKGFATLTPEVMLSELVQAGITTVVGCLGVDTTTRTMEALVAKAKGLTSEGLTAYAYTGGYDVPPVTLTGSVRRDLLFVQEIIAVGETAISDRRSCEPSLPELAKLVRDAYVGGLLSGKCGVTHFHVGDEATRLAPLRTLLDDYQMDPALLYPTHVERSKALMEEAVALTHRGVTVDIDVIEHDLGKWLRFVLEQGGNADRVTASSDAAIASPETLLDQVRSCILEHGFRIEQVLPLVTSTPARVLRLSSKGRLHEGADADVLVLRRDSLELQTVVARGRVLMREGRSQVRESFLAASNRRITLYGAGRLSPEGGDSVPTAPDPHRQPQRQHERAEGHGRK
jgi:beta-aspartyl-dipeptidase (metallo-type)